MFRNLHRLCQVNGHHLWLPLCAVLLCTICPGAIAASGPPEAMTLLDAFVVCDEPARQWNPSAADGLAIWSDERNADNDVYGYDLGTQTEIIISNATGNQVPGDTDARTVVWYQTGVATTEPDVYGYDLSTQATSPICTAPAGQINPTVSGRYVVWQDSRAASNNQDIYGYDLVSGTEFPVSTAAGSQVGPAIHGDIVVWMDYRNEPDPGCWPDCNTDIYGYDLSTGSEFPICTEASFQGYPAVYGDTVLWIDGRNGNWDIYGYDLTTNQEFAVSLEPTDQIAVTLNEDWIVWPDKRNDPNPATCGANCDYDLYGIHRDTGTETALVTHPAKQFQPALSGDLLYWADSRNDLDPLGCGVDCNFDIYGVALVSGQAGFPGGSTQVVGLDAPIVVTFALPMEPSSVTYTCTPDPGGWAETWNDTLHLGATNTVLTLTHSQFISSTFYAFTVTAGVDVLGRAIESFGFTFHTGGIRTYLPLVMRYW